MYKILTKLAPIFVAFLMCVNLPVYAKDYAHDHGYSEVDLYNIVYDTCLVEASEDDDFMGFLQTQEDFNGFCGCTAETAIDIHRQNIDESALSTVMEQEAIQCVKPYIKPFITNTCLAAAADNGITDMTQECNCFGEHVEAHSANNISEFFADTDKYLEASAQYCHLFE